MRLICGDRSQVFVRRKPMNTANKMIPNSTQIPNVVLDEWMPNLTDKEFKIIMVIARQTYGWHKDSDRISYTQLQKKTNSSRSSIGRTLSTLKDKGLVTVTKDNQDNWYQIRTSTKIALSSSTKMVPATSTIMGHTKETNTKQTNTKERKEISKEKRNVSPTKVSSLPTKYADLKDLSEQDFEEIAQKYQVPLSFVLSKYDDMVIWAESRPGNSKLRGRNWRMTLMKFVKDDAIKIHERSKGDPSKRAVDATNL